MFVIWGSTNRDEDVSRGTFFCPSCQQESRYVLREISRKFTLYFIPLFSTGSAGSYVECLRCHSRFDSHVIRPIPAGDRRRRDSSDSASGAGEAEKKTYTGDERGEDESMDDWLKRRGLVK